jgi:dihydroxy-acid dehydratase
VHINELARLAAAGANEAGGKAVIFNTITVSDGISMGTPGHALLAGLARGDRGLHRDRGRRPGLRWPGDDRRLRQEHARLHDGHRAPRPTGRVRLRRHDPPWRGHTDIVSVFEAVGGHARGTVSDQELHRIECTAIPGPGSCGGMYTANTMASAIEALGMSLPNSSAQEAESPNKLEDCRRAAETVMGLVRAGIRPRQIMTRKAFENAITTVIALGGSTNAVLHLLAIAHSARVRLTLDDFTRIGRRVPVLADLRPSGRYMMSELIAIGGIRPLMRRLLDAGLLHGECLTVTGRSMAEELAGVPDYPATQDVVRGFDDPIKRDSHLVILYGNLAPEGAVAKISGKEGLAFTGRARVYESESPACRQSSTAGSRRATSS